MGAGETAAAKTAGAKAARRVEAAE
jgi:hypothetical protein